MDDYYYIARANSKEGPYTLEDLQKLKLTDDILVWKYGFKDWILIKDVPELAPFIIFSPPPLPNQGNREKEERINEIVSEQKKAEYRRIIISNVIAAFLITICVTFIISENSFDNGYLSQSFPIYHSREELSNHYVYFFKIFPFFLLIIGSIVYIFIWKKIKNVNNKVKNQEILKRYKTNMGEITIIQFYSKISMYDYVFIDLNIAPDGKYIFEDKRNNSFINVKNGVVSSFF